MNQSYERYDKNDIAGWSYGKRLFEILIDADVKLTPQKIGSSDNLTSYGNDASFAPHWVSVSEVMGSVIPQTYSCVFLDSAERAMNWIF